MYRSCSCSLRQRPPHQGPPVDAVRGTMLCQLKTQNGPVTPRVPMRTVGRRSATLLRCALVLTQLLGPQAKSNGISFRGTGAWTLSEEYVARNRCNATGTGHRDTPPGQDSDASGIDCTYKLDHRLAACMAHFFRGLSVTELGAGVGRYKRYVDATGLAGEYTAYDGLSNVAALTRGRVQFVDLTVDSPNLQRSDFAISLEVAEHIPAKFEPTLMRNFDRSNRQGIVISWSNMGSSQSAHGHVNPKRKSQVRSLLAYSWPRMATWRTATRALICVAAPLFYI